MSERKKIKGWLNYHMTAAKDMDAGGHPVSLPEGCVGACFIWESKAAYKRAGYKNTTEFRRMWWWHEWSAQPARGESR